MIAGRLTRLLLDAGRVSADEAGLRMSRALSAAVPAPAAAGWAEGFLAGSGLLLVHDDKLLALADGWLAGLTADAFTAVLPRCAGRSASSRRRNGGRSGRRRPFSTAAAAAPSWSRTPATISTRNGRRSRPGPPP